MSKNLSAKYYQENKERLQIKACEKKVVVSNNMFVSNTEIFQMMKNKSLLSVEKNVIE